MSFERSVKHHTFLGTGAPNQVGILIGNIPNLHTDEEKSYVLSSDWKLAMDELDRLQALVDCADKLYDAAVLEINGAGNEQEEQEIYNGLCDQIDAYSALKGKQALAAQKGEL